MGTQVHGAECIRYVAYKNRSARTQRRCALAIYGRGPGGWRLQPTDATYQPNANTYLNTLWKLMSQFVYTILDTKHLKSKTGVTPESNLMLSNPGGNSDPAGNFRSRNRLSDIVLLLLYLMQKLMKNNVYIYFTSKRSDGFG